MEIDVTGHTAGRYFLTYGVADEGMLSGIEWKAVGGVLTVTDNAGSGLLEVTVSDTLGRIVSRMRNGARTLSIPLEKGVFVVEMRTAKEHKTAKIRI